MPYNNIISAADVAAMNTEQVSAEMAADIQDQSAALTLFRRIPVAKGTVRFPVLSALPTAYWVNGETGLKQTSEANWANKTMTIEEIAVIVPIPDSVVEDAEFDIWGAVRPLAAGAVGRILDAAIIFGTDVPASWGLTGGIVAAADAAGNEVFRGTATQAQGGIAEDLNQLFGKVEADGFVVNGMVSDGTFRARLRGARATDGQKLLDITNETVDGVRIVYGMPGQWPTGLSAAEMIAGDFTKGLIGVRRDFTFDLETTGVIQDNTGAIVYNAFQQDLTLLRVTFRVGFVVANPITRAQGTEANRYPFAVLRAPAS